MKNREALLVASKEDDLYVQTEISLSICSDFVNKMHEKRYNVTVGDKTFGNVAKFEYVALTLISQSCVY
jgi:hypothetical protein